MWYPGGSNGVVIACNTIHSKIKSCSTPIVPLLVYSTSWCPIGYQGESSGKGASQQQVTNHLNGLFSLVQGLGGTAVVRTYIDQLAQVLSALVGWSRIEKCNKGGCKGDPHGKDGSGKCKYLEDVTANDMSCVTCKCMKWKESNPGKEGLPVGRGCTRCKDENKKGCQCDSSGGGGCSVGEECKCAIEGKCCKCCCNKKCGKCSDKCSCDKDTEDKGYKSAYTKTLKTLSWVEKVVKNEPPTWDHLIEASTGTTTDGTASHRRHQCARILLGSVCLIWSGITYMYWTGKWDRRSQRWNNHILDGRGLDDGTLSQWLQALGFPRDMLNNSGPGNRLDAVIWDGIKGRLYWGFPNSSSGTHGSDIHENTFRDPAMLNYAGFIHTVEKGAFDSEVFRGNGTDNSIDQHEKGALFKLYILSCAYFTGLQEKRTSHSTTPKNPKTIREILYWLSALPYSPAYKGLLKHSKESLKNVAPDVEDKKQLSFYQTGLTHPITVHEYNLFAHFQAVTQYCPLVLIGIQGGLKGADSTNEPAIHSLYSNSHFSFTYPTVSIQAYNQVVHYIRALFYQLYFLRKQCAVKVTCGGKWRECRYGDGVVSKGVVSWMCLGCNPMEHDRKKRVDKVKDGLVGVKTGDEVKIKELLEAMGEVVVQLGNAQEALERKKTEGIKGVQGKLREAKEELDTAVKNGLKDKLADAKEKLVELTSGGSGALGEVADKLGAASSNDFDQGKNKISEAINGVCKALEALKEWAKGEIEKQKIAKQNMKVVLRLEIPQEYTTLLNAIEDLISLCNSPKCPGCKDHSIKCGKKPVPTTCPTCHQQYMDGFPSPLQAFLEDRLPGFSCNEVLNTEDTEDYPPAASHLGHCGGSGQCCPLPMGFRGHFHSGGISDMTGSRLYGILYFYSNENMMQSCVYTLVRVTAALSATTPQVLGDVFGFFRGGVGNPLKGKPQEGDEKNCDHQGDPSTNKDETKYFCGWCASGLRDEVQKIEWIPKGKESVKGGYYLDKVGTALINIKGEKGTGIAQFSSNAGTTPNNLSTLTTPYLSPLTGELYTAVSATFGHVYLQWVLYLSDALEGGLKSLASAFKEIECRGCRECDPNKCKKGEHGQKSDLCGCQSIVSCTGVLPVLYRHGFSYGNPFNLEGYHQKGKDKGDYSIEKVDTGKKHCHEFLSTLSAVIKTKEEAASQNKHPLSNLLSQVGQLQYDIRLPWIFVLTVAWLVAVLYLAFGAIWPLDWTHMRSHWLRGGGHQWQCMWYKVMTELKGGVLLEGMENFDQSSVVVLLMV